MTNDPMTMGFLESHTWDGLLLLGLAAFPRLALLFVGGPFSILHWLGWAVCPHVLVALMATARYWDTNPLLCIAAWVVAVVGTGGEGGLAKRRWRGQRITIINIDKAV